MSVEQKSEGLGPNILSTHSSNLGIQGTSTYRKTYHEWRVVSMTVMEKRLMIALWTCTVIHYLTEVSLCSFLSSQPKAFRRCKCKAYRLLRSIKIQKKEKNLRVSAVFSFEFRSVAYGRQLLRHSC